MIEAPKKSEITGVTDMSIHLVYVAGIFPRNTSWGRAKNMEAAKSAAHEILGMGRNWYPVSPMLKTRSGFATLPVDNLLPECDAMLVVGSKGVLISDDVLREMDEASFRGIPAFFDTETLNEYISSQREKD